MSKDERTKANCEVFERMCKSEPILTDLKPAIDVLPNMTNDTILTSGPILPWSDYYGGQRNAILGAALFEGLAESSTDADQKLASGRIRLGNCHNYNCVGSLAGVYTASMPVFVVQNATYGNTGYCNMYEGTNPKRLNYGVYDEEVRQRLLFVQEVLAPVIGDAIRLNGGLKLKPTMQRALHMGDELHSRNTAASLLFANELFPHFLKLYSDQSESVANSVKALTEDHYFFLRLSMAAAKCTADAAHNIESSSVVTAMVFNCQNFAIRISGLGDRWFLGPHASVNAKLFDGYTEDDIGWMGGESPITETIGLGGFAQACAFPLQQYQGGSAEVMVEQNVDLYQITMGENDDFRIPFLGYRGTPTAIDVFKVAEKNILPIMDIGIAGKDGGQIGAGLVRAPIECFTSALEFYQQTYAADPQ
ncbi:MAG: DUF1116 domain-containing protein [Pseudomonadota bacterium]|nr:DUF1116 domain-containing protein [Pseudomonadota bacterium]